MVMEFAVGRASQKSSCTRLRHPPAKAQLPLVWLVGVYRLHDPHDVLHDRRRLDDCLHSQTRVGSYSHDASVERDCTGVHLPCVQNPTEMIVWMLVAVAIGFVTCAIGLQKGVERITKCHDGGSVRHHARCSAFSVHDAARCGRGHRVLPASRFHPHLFAGDTVAEQWGTFGAGGLCRHGAGVLLALARHRRYGDLRVARWQRAQPERARPSTSPCSTRSSQSSRAS